MTPRTNAHRLVCWASISRHLGHSLAAALLRSCGSDAPGESSSLEPCSVLSADEAGRLLKGPVKQEVPSPIKYKGISTGGTCMYRSQKESNKSITVRTEATPTGAQRQRFEAGLRKAPGGEVSGIGDRAYIDSRLGKGFHGVTFFARRNARDRHGRRARYRGGQASGGHGCPTTPRIRDRTASGSSRLKGKREVGSWSWSVHGC